MYFLNQYMSLVVLGVCLCVGYILKHLVPGGRINRFIPLIMGVLGIGVNIWASRAVSPEVILGGLISGLSSTGMYEMFKNFFGSQKGLDFRGERYEYE